MSLISAGSFSLDSAFKYTEIFSRVITYSTYMQVSTFILAEIFLQHFRRKFHLQRNICWSGIPANLRKQFETARTGYSLRGLGETDS
jgi:hypothetical protein